MTVINPLSKGKTPVTVINPLSKGKTPVTEIIPQQIAHDNNYFSLAARSSIQKPLKLHSADMPYLKILYWFHSKGLTCYLTKEQWPEWLVRFGGKPIHYRKQKARWAKLRALGYITTYFTNGNRNKEMEHHLSQKGIQAVDNFQSQSRFKLKNGPSKIEKRPLEPVKNGPSLNHAQCENKHALNIERLMKEDPAKADSYRFMEDFGFFPAVALQVLKDYTRNQIYQAYTYTREKKPRNYGAYMLKILKKQLKKLNKEVA